MRPPIVRTVRDALTVALVLVPVVPGQTTLVSATTGDLFGFSVDVAGDYGTPAGFPAGVRDLVVGAPWRNSAAGAIDIVATPASGTTATAKVLSTLNGAAPGDGLGWAVAAGDVDADGIPDVVVSAPFFAGSGAVAAFSGAALATNTFTLLWFRLAPAGVTSYGFALSLAATTTPGVFDRLVVGAPNSNIVEVLRLTPGLPPTLQATFLSPFPPPTSFGFSVDSSGDLDGDGTPDIAVGDPGANAGAGLAMVFSGSTLAAAPIVTVGGLFSGDQGGFSVALRSANAGLGVVAALAFGTPTAGAGVGGAQVVNLAGTPLYTPPSPFPTVRSNMGYSVAFMLPRAIPAMPSGGVAIGCPLVPAAGVAGIGRVALFTDPAGTFVFSDRVAIPAASNYGTTVRTVNGAVGATYAANRMVAGAPSTTAAGVVRIF